MINFKLVVFCAVVLSLIRFTYVEQCNGNDIKKPVETVFALPSPPDDANVNVLTIYYPEYSKIDLVCGTMPSEKEDSVVFCCAAAYTDKCLKTFSYDNIVGSFVRVSIILGCTVRG